MEFLVNIKIIPDHGKKSFEDLVPLEAARARELVAAGTIKRLWRVPGRWENWGLWEVRDTDELHKALSSLPLYPYLDIQVHPMATHPSDPSKLLN